MVYTAYLTLPGTGGDSIHGEGQAVEVENRMLGLELRIMMGLRVQLRDEQVPRIIRHGEIVDKRAMDEEVLQVKCAQSTQTCRLRYAAGLEQRSTRTIGRRRAPLHTQ